MSQPGRSRDVVIDPGPFGGPRVVANISEEGYVTITRDGVTLGLTAGHVRLIVAALDSLSLPPQNAGAPD